MTKITIRPVKLGEIQQAADLMNSSYAIKKTPDYFRWRYFTNKGDLIWGAFEDRSLLGMIGTNNTQAADEQVLMVADMIVDEKQRMRGIFSQILNHVIASTESKVFISFTNKLGKIALENNSWTALLKIDNLVLSNNTKSPHKTLKPDASEKVGFHHGNSWMKWRFDQNPIYKYFSLQKDGDITVTKIFHSPDTGKKYGDIVFCEATGSYSPIISKAVSDLGSMDVSEVTTWALPNTQRYSELLELGFDAQPQERYMCILTKNKGSHLLNPNLWDIHQADSEIY